VFNPHPTPSDGPERRGDVASLRAEEQRSAAAAPKGSTLNTSRETVGTWGRQAIVASKEHPTKSDARQLRTYGASHHWE